MEKCQKLVYKMLPYVYKNVNSREVAKKNFKAFFYYSLFLLQLVLKESSN
jgi:hypothetical protein